MKKLTALLLGTVISIAFTADAFADPLAMAKKYWDSNDGKTGSYIGASFNYGDTDDITAPYSTIDGVADSLWELDDVNGGEIMLGYDFGKLRVDWRVGALKTKVASIDAAPLENGISDHAALAYSTLNLDLDLYRFVLIGEDKAWEGIFPVVAITPYVGFGAGYGGGWLTGKKASDSSLAAQVERDNEGHGLTYSYEAGALINIASFAGITIGYKNLNQSFERGQLGGSFDVESHLAAIGVRFTY